MWPSCDKDQEERDMEEMERLEKEYNLMKRFEEKMESNAVDPRA